jgi:hypothetical protein
MNSQDIQQLTEGAFKYGPFFFSILFVIFLTRWAYKKYDTAVTHVPPLDQRDRNINRTMFLTTFLFGIVLVVVSITWWWWFKPNVYFFRGQIRNLQQQEDIASDLYYLKREIRDTLSHADAEGLLRNEHFVIFQSHPFQKGQTFELDFAKNHQRRTQLWITHDPNEEEPVYELAYDETKQQVFLKHVAENSPVTTVSFFDWGLATKVFAAEPPQAKGAKLQAPPPETVPNEKLIAVLRDPRSDVAAKLDALDVLNRTDDEVLEKDLRLRGPEPFSLTIFDLTQHSDAELASKAAMLAKRIDLDEYLAHELSSNDPARREIAQKVLLRISSVHAQAILRRVDSTKYEDLKQFATILQSGGQTKILKPTASLQGDRYYVKATWNPSDRQTVACLELLFNKELESPRTLKQEQALMEGKDQRFVFWYSKDWALDISQEIKKCGGQAEFVHPY